SGNTSKLKIASAMLKSIRQTLSDKAIRLLTDCWFMNWTLMKPALELGYEVVGHIPKNRVLYALPIVAFPPSPFKKRGKPRKYGVKMTPDEVEKLPETRMPVWLYGKYRDVSFRSCICRARFLKGRIVRVVWSRFINDKGETEAKLFLSTNPDMDGHEVLLAYSKRWPIEPMFQQLKHQFGCKHLWQKKLRTLLRWMHIKMAGYALLQLLTICKNEAAVRVAKIDWRLPGTVTAGTLMRPLRLIIPQFRIRDCWNRYEQKSELISENKNNRTDSISSKAA
nr:transposase [Endozoicomonas sp.]